MLLSAGLSGFRMAWLIATADLAWMGAGYALGYVGPQLAAANGALSGLIWLVAAAAVLGEWQARLRVRVVLDRNLHTANEYHRRAQAYAQRGQWALAALHWRKAVAVDPHRPAYYKALGRAQARLGRAAAAASAWASGAELDPGDREFQKLLAK
jgi:tetratricopeptide (TPR) repeat protein